MTNVRNWPDLHKGERFDVDTTGPRSVLVFYLHKKRKNSQIRSLNYRPKMNQNKSNLCHLIG